MTTKKNKVLLHVPQEMSDMVQAIKEKKVFTSNSSVWFQALREFHATVFKEYVEVRKNRIESPKATALDRVKRKEADKEAKLQLLLEKKLDIMKKLGGRLVEYGKNHKTVQWYTYHSRGKDMQEMPIEMLTEDLIDNQFHGKREDIEKHQKVVPMKPLKPEEQAELAKKYEEKKL